MHSDSQAVPRNENIKSFGKSLLAFLMKFYDYTVA